MGPPEGLGRAVGPLLWGLDRPEDVFVRSLDYCLIRRLFFVDMKSSIERSPLKHHRGAFHKIVRFWWGHLPSTR